MMQQPHQPTGQVHSYNKPAKALGPIAEHFALGIALGDPKDDGSKEGKDNCGAEMRELQGQNHFFRPIAMW